MEEYNFVKILCKDGDNLYVSIHGSEVVLAREDPNDKTQQWFMDYSRARWVTDDNGQRAFTLVNKAREQVLVNKNKKRGDGCVQVQLAPYTGVIYLWRFLCSGPWSRRSTATDFTK
nr:unnamed protein product [Digitaria exilis]